MKKMFGFIFLCSMVVLVISCAGQRQGVVCDEIEYRLNSMSYSPDQRYYMEDELRACREEENQKKAESARTRQSIYDRFLASDSSKKQDSVVTDTMNSVGLDTANTTTADSIQVPAQME